MNDKICYFSQSRKIMTCRSARLPSGCGLSGVSRWRFRHRRPGAPSVLIVLRVRPRRPTPLGAVSLPVWSFADRTWSRGRLRCLRAILLEVPLLSTVIASPSLFTWAPLGIFLRLFKNIFHSHGEGFRLFLCLFLPFFLFLIFPTIIDCLSQL